MRYIEMAPSKLQKNGEKSTITIEYKHKKEKKPFKQEKIPIFIAFFTAFQTSDIITPIYLFYLFSIQSHTN